MPSSLIRPSTTNNSYKKRMSPTIFSGWLLDVLEAQQISLSEAAQELGVKESVFHNTYQELPFETYNNLLEWSALKLENDHLGITVALATSIKKLGILGFLIHNCANIEEYCRVLERYLPILQRGASIRFSQNAENCQLSYQVFSTDTKHNRQDSELTLAIMIQVLRRCLGQKWTPNDVFLMHEAPENQTVHHAVFGTSIHFNYAYNGFSFDKTLLPIAFSDIDPALLRILIRQADQSLEQINKTQDIVKHVRLLIAASLGQQALNSDKIAFNLHMSRRSLHRHLKEQGTSFQEIKNQIIITTAKQALAETQASITDIALQLGYSEISAFIRSFKHLTKITPLKYRKKEQS